MGEQNFEIIKSLFKNNPTNIFPDSRFNIL